MMFFDKSNGFYPQAGLLKPLTIAISSCLLFACAAPNNTTQNSKPVSSLPSPSNSDGTYTPPPVTLPSITPPSTPSTPSIIPEAQDVYAGVLDQATLDELEDLLQATDMSMVEGDAFVVERYGDLWDRVRRGYRMPQVQNSRIDAQKSWFYNRQDYLNRLTARTSRYLYYTTTEAERRGIPTELALLPIIESSYDPSATSNAAAAGLWQFIPSTGRIYGLNQSISYDGRRDIIESTRAAYDFLTSLYNQFGSWELALAAYNAGPGRIQRAIDANQAVGLPTDYWSLRLPSETMNYVPRFFAVAQIINSPNSYGVYLPAIANHVHFRAVPVNYGVTLSEVSQVTGVPFDELRLLNAGLIGLKVDNLGPSRIIIPNDVPTSFDSQLKALQGDGYGGMSQPINDYVVPKFAAPVNSYSTQELAATNTLPTTAARITNDNTIMQEPPLSQEERDFIAAQIQATAESVQPISKNDGNIEFSAVQTGQSVLEARGETKSLSFNAPSNTPSPSRVNPSRNTQRPERYKVVAGDTLTGVAAEHGLTVSQLAQYNDIPVDSYLRTGERLWLVPGKVSTVSRKSDKPSSARTKTITHTVQSGESLTSVAKKYNITIQDLAASNGLSVTDGILIDQKLTIPNGSQPVNQKSAPATQSKSKSSDNKPVSYTIQSGDSLTSVAKKYNISIDELAIANRLDKNAGLIRGKTLTIPAKGTVKIPKADNNQAKNQKSGSKIKSTESYKVQAGDSLYALASKYGVSVADLATTNKLSTNAQLRRGQVIQVPKLTDIYTVKSGESLTSIAKKYNISISELAKMNNLSENAGLQIGQKLIVPN